MADEIAIKEDLICSKDIEESRKVDRTVVSKWINARGLTPVRTDPDTGKRWYSKADYVRLCKEEEEERNANKTKESADSLSSKKDVKVIATAMAGKIEEEYGEEVSDMFVDMNNLFVKFAENHKEKKKTISENERLHKVIDYQEKEIHRLELSLDEADEYLSVQRVLTFNKIYDLPIAVTSQLGKTLSNHCRAKGLAYGTCRDMYGKCDTVNQYPRAAWLEVYPEWELPVKDKPIIL